VLGETRAAALVEQTLAQLGSEFPYCELAISVLDSQLTRFANNRIHQNVAEYSADARVRVVQGRRESVVGTNDLTPAGLAETARQALALIQHQPEAAEPPTLPETAHRVISTLGVASATAASTPDQRAEAVAAACQIAREANVAAFGFLSAEVQERVVANTRDLFCYHQGTAADSKVTVMAEEGAGAASQAAASIDQLDLAALASEAIRRAAPGQRRRALPPGTYPVLLDVYAVADVVRMLGTMGFGALTVQEGRSFLTDRFGQSVLGPQVTIRDDAIDPTGLPAPFDWEGVPTQPVTIIDQGVARAAVYDLATAAHAGRASTGHGLRRPNTFGPWPLHLVLSPGDSSLESLVAGMDRGVFISHFWYTRTVHDRWTVVTGMTRDGAFWVENGEIAYPIENLRFTQSYAQALQGVEAIGGATRLLHQMMATLRVPAVRLSSFEFTGQSG